jgi:hypothetical protein
LAFDEADLDRDGAAAAKRRTSRRERRRSRVRKRRQGRVSDADLRKSDGANPRRDLRVIAETTGRQALES